ncbi:ABC transporter substrate-binding protein [Lederbergia graminis]|uniref:ABC transporter substrate-binding protein n=1 Tax=Lederbergia graminis TaxID=735518 RepID=A0ABW0LPC2_9BACI
MKKVFSLLAISVLIFVLAACSGSESSGKNDSGNKKGDSNDKKEEVTISYAHWNLGTEEEMNLERLMLEQFQRDYPHIKVELYEISGNWNEQLAAAASANNMPDVFAVPDLPLALSNDWVLDVTVMAENDTDFGNVPQVVRQSTEYNKQIVALPFAQHFLGYFVNKDLYNEANLDYPTMDSTVEEFEAAVKDITNVQAGVIGLQNAGSIADWYPAAANPDSGWYTYTDGKYELNSSEYIAGVKFANEVVTNGYSYDNLTDEQKANFKGEDGNQVWFEGDIGIKWDGSWAVSSLVENSSFEFDFIGIPGGKIVITNDLLGISQTTKHAEEAFIFAKYMSFGKEGFMKRMELAAENGKVVNTLPVNTDQEILDEYFAQAPVPGIQKAYERLDEAILEPVKTVPGYAQSRWHAPTGVKVGEHENATIGQLLDAIIKGELKIEDYATQLNDLANAKYEEAVAALEN